MSNPLNIQADDFTLFDLAPRFRQERSAIDAAWKQLQAQAHPDKFASQGASAQRLAMQWSVRINEAYQRLKNPIQRAAYLCALQGQAINAHSNTAMPSDFLMQQMEWREALEEALQAKPSHAQALEALLDEAAHWQKAALVRCATLLDEAHDYAAAAQTVRQLLFVEKFIADVENALAS